MANGYGAHPGDLNDHLSDPEPIGMLSLSNDEWAILCSMREFQRLLDQIQAEYDSVRDAIAERAVLDADSAERTAINYALNCGRLEALREILTYKPRRD